MQTISTSNFTSEQLEEMNSFALSEVSDEVREFMLQLISSIRDGGEIRIAGKDDFLTPKEAATQLGMSRTHLYKLLDRGELPYYFVGTHRRIRIDEFRKFELKLHGYQKELAEKFARHDEIVKSADEEILKLLQ